MDGKPPHVVPTTTDTRTKTPGPGARPSASRSPTGASSDHSSWFDVLHVEVDIDVTAVTAAYLSRYRLRLHPVRSKEAAVERLGSGSETRFDCIVSDHRPGRLDGIGLCNRVRQRFPDLPFLLFTGEWQLEGRAKAAGVDAVVRKTGRPEQFETLADRIRATVPVLPRAGSELTEP